MDFIYTDNEEVAIKMRAYGYEEVQAKSPGISRYVFINDGRPVPVEFSQEEGLLIFTDTLCF